MLIQHSCFWLAVHPKNIQCSGRRPQVILLLSWHTYLHTSLKSLLDGILLSVRKERMHSKTSSYSGLQQSCKKGCKFQSTRMHSSSSPVDLLTFFARLPQTTVKEKEGGCSQFSVVVVQSERARVRIPDGTASLFTFFPPTQ